MKRHIIIVWVIVMSSSCHLQEKHAPANDSTLESGLSGDTTKGGNWVHSEAPDAVTRVTQGYALPKFDDGMGQSPINILSDSTLQDSNQFSSIQFHAGIVAIENLGHTIQLDFQKGSTTKAGGFIYESKQIHFHTPSEHMIDGITYPMEMHIVNVLNDSNHPDQKQYLVIALLFRMGRENKFIKEFFNRIPDPDMADSLVTGMVQLEDLINSMPEKESSGYYTYNGSLTTPPYSETVTWIVKKYILQASPEQINRIEKMEGDNARHVRALYARKVFNH